jgi:hypothetical protein
MDLTFYLIAASAIAFWGTVLYLALRFVRGIEGRKLGARELEELRSRVTEIEKELAVSRAELSRLGAAESHAAMMLARLTDPARGTG